MHKASWRGAMPAQAIIEQLPTGELDDSLYEALGRWCNMKKPVPEIEDNFRQIARILFGRAPQRK